jgi:hypothetical protein
MIILVGMSVNQDFDLVSKDYYQEEMNYQSRIDKISNAQNLETPLQFELKNENEILELHFPENMKNISGTVQLYRPTNAKKDVKVKIQTDTHNSQVISTKNLEKGLWRVKIDWQHNLTEYYNEEIIVIN